MELFYKTKLNKLKLKMINKIIAYFCENKNAFFLIYSATASTSSSNSNCSNSLTTTKGSLFTRLPLVRTVEFEPCFTFLKK